MARVTCETPGCGNIVLGMYRCNRHPLCRGCAGEKRRAAKLVKKAAALPQDEAEIVAYCKRRQWKFSPNLGGAVWIFDKRGDALGCADTAAEALRNAVIGEVFGPEPAGA